MSNSIKKYTGKHTGCRLAIAWVMLVFAKCLKDRIEIIFRGSVMDRTNLCKRSLLGKSTMKYPANQKMHQ